MNQVILADYDPSWPQRFTSLKSAIWPAVADIAISIAADMVGYVEGKTTFLLSILRKVGFAESILSEIECMNRRPAVSS